MAQIILVLATIVLAAFYTFLLTGKSSRSFSSVVLAVAVIAVVALEIFDLLIFLRPRELDFWKKFSLAAEGCMVPLWLLACMTYAREEGLRSVSHARRFILLGSLLFPAAALLLPVSSIFYSPDFSTEHILFLGESGYLFYIGILVFLVISLVQLENTLAGSMNGSRWRIKLEALGAISLLAVLLFYYSQGLLYRVINMNFIPLRILVVNVGLALMIYSRLRRGGGAGVFVSKQMAFRSVTLLAVGTYLIGLGLMGEGMRYFGEPFSRSMAIAAAFLAGLGMCIILLSETVKRKIKVFLHSNFYRQKYDYRAQWIQFTDRMVSSGSGSALLKSIVSGFSEVFGMGCGALFLYDEDRRVYRVAAQMEMEDEGILFEPGRPFATFLAKHGLPVDVRAEGILTETSRAAFFSGNEIAFAVPLMHNGSLEGFVVLGRQLSKGEIYDYEDYDLMTTLARQATSAVLNLRLSEELSRARQLEAMGRLSAFIAHDLKNLASSIALVIDNARQFMDNPDFRNDMLQTLGNTVEKMKALVGGLKKYEENASPRRDIADLLDIARSVVQFAGTGEVRVGGETVFSEVDVEEIRKVVLNLVLNALEATGGKGEVSVEAGYDGAAFIRVRDNGCGMTENYLRDHLFKLFRTTKEKGLGIGLYQCKQIIDAHGGKIEVSSSVDRGSIFTVRLPHYNGPASQACGR